MLRSNEKMLASCECIMRMEIGSLIRYVSIKSWRIMNSNNDTIAFFTPCEELKGSSIFSQLSHDYNLISPYLERVDTSLIQRMNI